MHIAISVIVPIYRAEDYLSRCIESVLAQSFVNFELLLIDDGSPDKSGEICRQYALKDARVRLFRKVNEGVSATRQFGVEHAQGKYIQFIDSDDWVEPDMLAQMYDAAQQRGAEIVGCNFVEELPGRSIRRNNCYATKNDFLRAVIRSEWGVVWKILILRELFIQNDIHFPKNINGGEDYIICTKLLFYAKNVTCIEDYLYHYIRYNPYSIMSSTCLKKIEYQIDATRCVECFLREKNVEFQYARELAERKLVAKYDLLQIDGRLWFKIFPETNHAWRQILLSRSRKLIHLLAEKRLFGLIKILFYFKYKLFKNR